MSPRLPLQRLNARRVNLPRPRRQFSAQEKQQAVALALFFNSVALAARRLNMSDVTLRTWVRAHRRAHGSPAS